MKTNKKKRRLYTLIPVSVMLLGLLSACGASSTGVEGTYRGTGMSYSGFDMDLDGDANYIELKNGGKGTISLEGTTESFKWKTDDNAVFTFTIEGDDYTATLDNGTLSLDLLGINYIYQGENGAGAGMGASDDTSVSAKSGSVLDRLQSLAGGGEPYVPEDGDPRINNISGHAGADYGWDPTWGHEGFEYDGESAYESGGDLTGLDSSDDSSVTAGAPDGFTDDGDGWYVDSSGVRVSQVALNKGIPASNFGTGITDAQTMAETYVWIEDQDDAAQASPDFLDQIASRMGSYPLDDNEHWKDTDGADKEVDYLWKTEDESSELSIIFDINDDGSFSYRNGSISGDAMDIWADLMGYEW
ncbi:MAG: hypothetical protein IJS12_06175 [Lachnospiraceae bacterium]|nr:hypothetical protein [Lachnospiraceae bacterium]